MEIIEALLAAVAAVGAGFALILVLRARWFDRVESWPQKIIPDTEVIILAIGRCIAWPVRIISAPIVEIWVKKKVNIRLYKFARILAGGIVEITLIALCFF